MLTHERTVVNWSRRLQTRFSSQNAGQVNVVEIIKTGLRDLSEQSVDYFPGHPVARSGAIGWVVVVFVHQRICSRFPFAKD